MASETRWRWAVLRHTFGQLRAAASHERECNICGFRGHFYPMGWPVRPEALCPSCGSLERHRELKVWIDANPNVFNNREVLHFAPEKAITAIVKASAAKYVTADIDGSADLTLDIEALALPDKSFDAVVCSHVLEHVDDRLALKEIYRVLRPAGIGVMVVPIIEGWQHTYENPGLAEKDRQLHFGQSDHVRMFGADVRERIKAVGFTLTEYTAEEPLASRHGLLRGSKVFIASR